jgi:DNA repair exonuclease SbcCD nuclease subunit
VLDRLSLPGELTAVLAGHIHRAQVLDKGPGPAVVYAGSIERTSFAERDEAKGFFDLTFAVFPGQPCELVERAFIELPARPMAGVTVPAGLRAGAVREFLRAAGARLPENAVVRIDCEGEPHGDVLRELTNAALREALPPGACIRLSRRVIGGFAR